ncbi:MAG TPA: tetratricopeptide repeat protein [Blastocatellia bacterium]|nr:tetratricopeptide repeat protein [Blastocatellia bacterium]
MKKIFVVSALLISISVATSGATPFIKFDWEKAVSLYKQGLFREAIAEFRKVLEEASDHADSWKFIGLAYYQLKDYKSAIQPLEKALELKRKENRNDPDLYRGLGQSHMMLKNYEKALPYFETLVRIQMNVAANYYLLGVTYANLNRAEEASDAFQKSVKLDPKDSDSWYYLGVAHFRAGRLNDAIAALRSGTAADPKNVEMLGLLAESLLRQGANENDEKKANSYYDEAIRVATNLKSLREDAASLQLLGRAFLQSKKYTNAEMTLARALEVSKPPSAALYFNLGLAHAQNKSWARAADMLAQADKLNPGDFNTLYYLGYVYENLRRYPQALDAYNRAYEASGRNNPDLKASIDRVTPLAKQDQTGKNQK